MDKPTDANNYITLFQSLPEHQLAGVDSLRQQAISYVWGWQDGRGDEKDTDVSIRFGTAYGIHAAEYALGRRGSRRNIGDAFKQWQTNGVIDE